MEKFSVFIAIIILLVFIWCLYWRVRKTNDLLDKAKDNLNEIVDCSHYSVSDTSNACTTSNIFESYETPNEAIRYDSAGRDITELSNAQCHLVVDFFHQYNAARAKDKSKPVKILLVNSVGETISLSANNQKQVAVLLNGIFGLNKGLSTYLNILKKAKS